MKGRPFYVQAFTDIKPKSLIRQLRANDRFGFNDAVRKQRPYNSLIAKS